MFSSYQVLAIVLKHDLIPGSLGQRLVKVVNEISHIFNTDGEPDLVRGNPRSY